MQKVLVSIVIPAYNAAPFIEETIWSILQQTYNHFEIIIINDGSTDNTEGVVLNFNDSRIQHLKKINEGVSTARNQGFNLTKGKYVVFFDADDIMDKCFLSSRVIALEKDDTIGFCCGNIKTFPQGNTDEMYGACDNIPKELLLYDLKARSCPSNYMFRTKELKENNLTFNANLSSSADMLFLLEVALYMNGKRVFEGDLKYRVNANSMSNNITQKLMRDNELFYEIVLKKKLIPISIYFKAIWRKNYILSIGYLKYFKSPRSIYFVLIFFRDIVMYRRNTKHIENVLY